jgi:hypothetical protein
MKGLKGRGVFVGIGRGGGRGGLIKYVLEFIRPLLSAPGSGDAMTGQVLNSVRVVPG